MLDRFLGKDGSFLYIVFEHCPTDLWRIYRHDPVGHRGLLKMTCIFRFMGDISRGLNHLHSLHMAHGDLSMKNILADVQHRLKIADFGTAHCAHSCVNPDGEPMTTLYVRAPEVMMGDPSHGRPADYWAVGVIALALSTGEIPFFSDDVQEVFGAHALHT